MAQKSKSKRQPGRYRRVRVDQLNRGRKGKHHQLIQRILEQLTGLEGGAALEIPLADVGGVELANLRSAVHRASLSAGLLIETLSDQDHFYLWKKARSQA
jgi:hypothetical protein